jgi:hypothetical protein
MGARWRTSCCPQRVERRAAECHGCSARIRGNARDAVHCYCELNENWVNLLVKIVETFETKSLIKELDCLYAHIFLSLTPYK